MYQSQLPPSRLPPTIEFLTMTDEFVFGGMSGEKSDSTTPIPPAPSCARWWRARA
jgi:hypothetical protein